MYKVGICGHFGLNKELLNGQTIKTKTITTELKARFKADNVQIVDTYNWKHNPLKLLLKCFFLIKNCNNVVILPAQNGVKVFAPLFSLMNTIFNRRLHYIVIGGWLPDLLESNKKLKKQLNSFNGIYVETHSMMGNLKKIGLKNTRYLPNFKRLKILKKMDLVYYANEPYKLCTFSRVIKEKGIEDAIKVVKSINSFFNKTIYTLDIFGQVDESYVKRFKELENNLPDYISYRGVINYNESVNVLKDYFALLFPTYYKGEGFPGTILDAFASGLPVVATNWRYNSEIIQDQVNGIIFDYKNIDELQNILLDIYRNPSIILNMKENCLKEAKKYTPENVVDKFIRYID